MKKPEITTIEERDELPEGAVVRSNAGTIASLEQGVALLFGLHKSFPKDVLDFPLTVLYRPDRPTLPTVTREQVEEAKKAAVKASLDNIPVDWMGKKSETDRLKLNAYIAASAAITALGIEVES